MAELIHSDKDLFILKHFKDNHVGLSLSGEPPALPVPWGTPSAHGPFHFPLFSCFYTAFPAARTAEVTKEQLEEFEAQLRCHGFKLEEAFITSPKVWPRRRHRAPRGGNPCRSKRRPPLPRMPVLQPARRRAKAAQPPQSHSWGEPTSPPPALRSTGGRPDEDLCLPTRTSRRPSQKELAASLLTWNKAVCDTRLPCARLRCAHAWDGVGVGSTGSGFGPHPLPQVRQNAEDGWLTLTRMGSG